MRNLFSLLLVTILLSCSSAPDPVKIAAEDVPIKVIPASVTAPEATLYIQGMSCEKMCVSKVKATLAAMEGVDVSNIDFDADRDVDSFTVTFEDDKSNELELIRAVNAIAGGAYSVQKVDVKRDVKVTSSTSTVGRSSDWSYFRRNDMKSHRFQIPNVFDALKSLCGI